MFVQSGALEIPTTTVVLDLFSRTGLETEYSLSPFKGKRGDRNLGRIIGELQSEGILEANVREQREDFTFSHNDAMYSLVQQAIDAGDSDFLEDMYADGADEPESYSPGQVLAPEYIRRFEDGYPLDSMERYLRHFTANLTNNNSYYKKYKENHRALDFYTSGEDEEEVTNAGEEQAETLTNNDIGSIPISKIREDLIYCLYRFNLFSRVTHINILSLVLAHIRLLKRCLRTDPTMPKRLLSEDIVYYADSMGNCVEKVTNPQDLNLTRARGILTTKTSEASEFHSDFDLFYTLYTRLDVNVFEEDPTQYTWEFIDKYSSLVLISNGHYVSREFGGYNKDNYYKLLNMPLDSAAKDNAVVECDDLSNAYRILSDSDTVPNDVHLELSLYERKQFQTALEVAKFMVEVVPHSSFVTCTTSTPNYEKPADDNGFLVDNDNNPIVFFAQKILNSAQQEISLGSAYVHASGYVIFGTVTSSVCIMRLEDFIKCCDREETGDGWVHIVKL